MKDVVILLLGMGIAFALIGGAFLLFFKRGGWELEQCEREDRYAE